MNKFLFDWNVEEPLKQIAEDFNINEEVLKDINIIVASYTYENYSGDATVIFEINNELYIVDAGHCSCYGLEGQWKPEKISYEYLHHISENGKFSYNKTENDLIISTINKFKFRKKNKC